MKLKEQVALDLQELSESELSAVADYVAFLKFRTRLDAAPKLDEMQLAAIYAEFNSEDRNLAEEGIEDYERDLLLEDAR